jgi:hypothetical protein
MADDTASHHTAHTASCSTAPPPPVHLEYYSIAPAIPSNGTDYEIDDGDNDDTIAGKIVAKIDAKIAEAKIAAAKIAAATKTLAAATKLTTATLNKYMKELSWDTKHKHDEAATNARIAANHLADLTARKILRQKLYDVDVYVFTSNGSKKISCSRELFTSAQVDWMTRRDISKLECETVSEMLLKLLVNGRAFK